MERNFFEQIKRIQALAEIGLHYSQSNYDTERYEEIQQICLGMLGALTNLPLPQIKIAIEENNGYKTPKVDVRAVVFNDEGKILLVREKVDGGWTMPGGWADIGYTPRMIAEKECFEEAGLTVKASNLLAVLDKTAQKMQPAFEYVYKLFIWCEPLNNQISTGAETTGVGWFSENEIPTLSEPRTIESQIHLMFEYYRGERTEITLD